MVDQSGGSVLALAEFALLFMRLSRALLSHEVCSTGAKAGEVSASPADSPGKIGFVRKFSLVATPAPVRATGRKAVTATAIGAGTSSPRRLACRRSSITKAR